MATRAQILLEARKWLNTPFAARGRTLGQQLDCVGLPLMVAEALGLRDKSGMPLNGSTYTTYSDQPVGSFVNDACMAHLVYKPVREMEPGDVLTMSIPDSPCHVGIVGEDSKRRITIIHAYAGGAAKVVEHLLDEKWRRRICACYSFPEVED